MQTVRWRAITAEGDDGGESENGVRDTNTRHRDSYGCPKIETNYREGVKRKDGGGGQGGLSG